MNRSYYDRNRMVTHRMVTESPAAVCPCERTVTRTDDCGDMVVAMAYVPWQTLGTVYQSDTAFMQGTLFPELDKPLMVGGERCG